MLGNPNGGRWNIDAIWEVFPRLAERRKVGAAQLSGGEQQMLAIARALLRNPKLIVMDEPSEGLAPTIIENLVGTCERLVQEGVGLLLIEQNLGVAASLANRQLVMVAGSIQAETTGAALLADPEAQQRYLGVTRIEETRSRRGAVMATVVLLGTLDTKGEEYEFLRRRVLDAGVDALLVDTGVLGSPLAEPDISRQQVAEAAGADVQELAASEDRGRGRGDGPRRRRNREGPARAGRLDAVLALGGSGGTAIAAQAVRELPVGVPKLIVSTMASGHAPLRRGRRRHAHVFGRRHRRAESDLGAHPRERSGGGRRDGKGAEARSRVGETSRRGHDVRRHDPCVTEARKRLEELGYEVLVFHATGTGASRWRRSCAPASSPPPGRDDDGAGRRARRRRSLGRSRPAGSRR